MALSSVSYDSEEEKVSAVYKMAEKLYDAELKDSANKFAKDIIQKLVKKTANVQEDIRYDVSICILSMVCSEILDNDDEIIFGLGCVKELSDS